MGFLFPLRDNHCYSYSSVNNGFGINFLRFVCEEDQNFWAQVFARLPYDETEIKNKGALFGLIFGKDKTDWGDVEVEMTNWVEEYFNNLDKGGDLASFYEEFSQKFLDIDCLWLWIVMKDEKRIMKVVGRGEVFLRIVRKGNQIDISKNLPSQKVIVGELLSGDEIRLWSRGLTDNFEEWPEIVGQKDRALSGFKIDILPFVPSVEVVDDVKNDLESVVADEEMGTIKIAPKIESEPLVRDRYVGPITLSLRVKNFLLRFKSRSERLEIRDESKKKKGVSVFLGLVFLVLLIASLFVGGIKKKGELKKQTWLSFSEPITKNVTEAVSLVKLNQSGSKKLVEEARVSFDAQKASFVGGEYESELQILDKKINDAWIEVTGEKRGEVSELVNLDLIRAGVDASRISWTKGSGYGILSTNSGLVMSADIKTKDIKVLAGKGAGLGWIDSASDGTKQFVLTRGGVFVVGNESNSLVFDTAITEPLTLLRFGNGLYVLEKGNKEVFKYTYSDTGFGERARWFKESQLMGVVPVDMAIDVDIWVVSEKGVVERFRRGVKENFALTGLPVDVQISRIAVEREGNRIALLSSVTGTVFFCSKESGSCNQQIKADKLFMARDIEFDEENKLVVLFPGFVGVLN